MSILGINLKLALGKLAPSPAPSYIAEALQSVEIHQGDQNPAGFTLTFHADREKGLSRDFELLSSPLLKPSNRVVLSVVLGGAPTVIMDGFITQQELAHSREFGASTLTVTGEDVSVAMDLYELSFEYPTAGDAVIAGIVLAKYTAIGIIPEIIPTPGGLIPVDVEKVPQQNSTDRAYLQELAAPHGFVFYVKPGPAYLMNTAYWGPPDRLGAPQKALSVDMGPATNVESISFQYNALAPALVHGMVQDLDLETDFPVVTVGGMRVPPLASEPATIVNQPFVRNRQFTDPRYGIARALDMAQAQTDVCSDAVVTATGELDVLRYGAVLDAPGIVGVRGAGYSYDGNYYVQGVVHQISRGSYKQNFTLTREGAGSLTTMVRP